MYILQFNVFTFYKLTYRGGGRKGRREEGTEGGMDGGRKGRREEGTEGEGTEGGRDGGRKGRREEVWDGVTT